MAPGQGHQDRGELSGLQTMGLRYPQLGGREGEGGRVSEGGREGGRVREGGREGEGGRVSEA